MDRLAAASWDRAIEQEHGDAPTDGIVEGVDHRRLFASPCLG
jgi:hypothetical protein